MPKPLYTTEWAETFRDARGTLTQGQLAKLLSGPTRADHLPVATIADWEQGRREPPKWCQWLILGQLLRQSLPKKPRLPAEAYL